MIELMPESTGNIVGIRATGTLTGADYEKVFIPRLEELFGEYGRLRILLYMDEGFAGWDLSAAWDDAAFGLTHRDRPSHAEAFPARPSAGRPKGCA